jgi:hypothetical protein
VQVLVLDFGWDDFTEAFEPREDFVASIRDDRLVAVRSWIVLAETAWIDSSMETARQLADARLRNVELMWREVGNRFRD